jgi:hypothetical protein
VNPLPESLCGERAFTASAMFLRITRNLEILEDQAFYHEKYGVYIFLAARALGHLVHLT